MLHTDADGPDERRPHSARRSTRWASAPPCWSTPTTSPPASANAVAAAGTGLGAVRIDSGDLGVLARQVREQLDGLGATGTRIVVSGDLDEFSIAALRAEPVDSYGVGTSLVTGSGAPTASMVYKLVEVDGIPVREAQQPQGIPRRPQGGAAAVASRPAPSPRRSCIRPATPPHAAEPVAGC